MIDTDVIVAEVRETSRKPDEIYEIIERMCPGGRKIGIVHVCDTLAYSIFLLIFYFFFVP